MSFFPENAISLIMHIANSSDKTSRYIKLYRYTYAFFEGWRGTSEREAVDENG